jgi:hypothetical protein
MRASEGTSNDMPIVAALPSLGTIVRLVSLLTATDHIIEAYEGLSIRFDQPVQRQSVKKGSSRSRTMSPAKRYAVRPDARGRGNSITQASNRHL